ncbi:hypothetical protein BG000_007553 [Podila horticola]|nr:hypothetical protein BG000_007553 [Podila horticola]
MLNQAQELPLQHRLPPVVLLAVTSGVQIVDAQQHVISIQNVGVEINDHVEELWKFVKFLDKFPGITGFYSGFSLESLIRRHLILPKTLWAVLDHRLDLVNDQHVHSCRKADRGLTAPATGAESDFWCSTPKIHKEQHMRTARKPNPSAAVRFCGK